MKKVQFELPDELHRAVRIHQLEQGIKRLDTVLCGLVSAGLGSLDPKTDLPAYLGRPEKKSTVKSPKKRWSK